MKTLYLVFEGFRLETHGEMFARNGFHVVAQEFAHGTDAFLLDSHFFWQLYTDAGMRVGIIGVPDIFPVPRLGSGFYHAGFPFIQEIGSVWPTWDHNIVRDPNMWARIPNRDRHSIDWKKEVLRQFPPDTMMDAAFRDAAVMMGAYSTRAAQFDIRVGLVWFAWPARLRQITSDYKATTSEECARAWAMVSDRNIPAKHIVWIGLSAKTGFIASKGIMVPDVNLDVFLREGIEWSPEVPVVAHIPLKLREDLGLV